MLNLTAGKSAEEAAEIHGITNEYATTVGLPEEHVVTNFMMLFEILHKTNGVRVAHNTTFDNRIIRIALKRYFSDKTADLFKEATYECTGLLSKPIMKMEPKNRYGYKMPKLSEAYEYFTGKELENAHSAIADTNACLDIYWAIIDGARNKFITD